MIKILKNAPGYEYIGKKRAEVFTRGNTTINLETITDKRIEQLLEEDNAYWSRHFKKKIVRKKKSQSSDEED